MTKTEQMRQVSWRQRLLACAADGHRDVARTCRHFGISRKTFYKWKRRHQELGEAALADRPRRPRRSPGATPPEVVSKILYPAELPFWGRADPRLPAAVSPDRGGDRLGASHSGPTRDGPTAGESEVPAAHDAVEAV
jgi:hypothetical protein